MKNMVAALFVVSAVLFFAQDGVSQGNALITESGAGTLKIGMSVRDAKRALPDHEFSRTSDGEGLALIRVAKGGKDIFFLFAGEEDPDRPIDQSAEIEMISVTGGPYRTSEGLRPGMKLADAEKLVGKVTEIFLSEIEAREFVKFARSDKWNIRVASENGMAGVYAAGSNTTTKYASDAYIYDIAVFKGVPDEEISSRYTDLSKDCKAEDVSEESSHSSTKCDGPAGYYLHFYDSAMTLEFGVEDQSGERVHIASQALSYDLKKAKLEWRLKGDEPFAVIFRKYAYEKGDDGLIKYPAKETGEYLVIKGLPKYKNISGEIDVRKTPEANVRAREIADIGLANRGPGDQDFLPIDVREINETITKAAKNSESWVRSPMAIIARIAGEFEELSFRQIEIESPGGEGSTSLTVVITDDGFLDDSVRGEKKIYKLESDESGVWKLLSGSKAWRCQPGRGHPDWGTAPCI